MAIGRQCGWRHDELTVALSHIRAHDSPTSVDQRREHLDEELATETCEHGLVKKREPVSATGPVRRPRERFNDCLLFLGTTVYQLRGYILFGTAHPLADRLRESLRTGPKPFRILLDWGNTAASKGPARLRARTMASLAGRPAGVPIELPDAMDFRLRPQRALRTTTGRGAGAR